MKYKVLIVDDEPLARRGIRLRLKAYPDFVILDDCEDGFSAIEAIEKHAPDLVFLDIQMRGLTGFEVLNHIPKNRTPFIIFLTAYDQYALNAFEVQALDYLLKPVDSNRFAEAVARARRQLKLANAGLIEDRMRTLLEEYRPEGEKPRYVERFAVRTGRHVTFVLADEIDWIEAAGDYVRLHVGGKRPLVREKLNDLEFRLDPEKFVRIHRTAIVQISRIRDVQKLPNRDLRLRLVDGTNLRASRTYRNRFDLVMQKS